MSDALLINPASAGVRGEVSFPGDKSISHRAVMFAAIAQGESCIRNCSLGGDNRSTIGAFRALGVRITQHGTQVVVHGRGWEGLQAASQTIDCGNSGTTTRLLCGLLAGRLFASVLDGDASLRSRPMGRVIDPLRKMGAHITSEGGDNRAPVRIYGVAPDRLLHGFLYRSRVASAQIKSSIMLAGLQAQGTTQVWEPVRSRDHTERMLPAFGAQVSVQGTTVSVTGGQSLHACEVDVPGDISSAAFFIGAALIVPNSVVRIREVGLNPTRTGVLDVFRAMGGSLRIVNEREICGEPVGDVVVETSALKGIEIDGELVVRAIDELPIIAVVAACAQGTTTIRGAQELRVKESDRIQTIATALQTLGVTLTELPDGLVIEGRGVPSRHQVHYASPPFQSGSVHTAGDHRIAMALSVAGLVAAEPIVLDDATCVAISFPDFYSLVQGLTGARIQAV